MGKGTNNSNSRYRDRFYCSFFCYSTTGSANTGTGNTGTGTTGTGTSGNSSGVETTATNTGTGTTGTANTGTGTTGTGTTGTGTTGGTTVTLSVERYFCNVSKRLISEYCDDKVNNSAHTHSIPGLSIPGLFCSRSVYSWIIHSCITIPALFLD